MDFSRITKVILKNCQKIGKMTNLTVKNGILTHLTLQKWNFQKIKCLFSNFKMFWRFHCLRLNGSLFIFFGNFSVSLWWFLRYPWHATYYFGLFFSNNYDGKKHISFQDLHDPRGVIFPNFRLILIGPMEGKWWILI